VVVFGWASAPRGSVSSLPVIVRIRLCRRRQCALSRIQTYRDRLRRIKRRLSFLRVASPTISSAIVRILRPVCLNSVFAPCSNSNRVARGSDHYPTISIRLAILALGTDAFNVALCVTLRIRA